MKGNTVTFQIGSSLLDLPCLKGLKFTPLTVKHAEKPKHWLTGAQGETGYGDYFKTPF